MALLLFHLIVSFYVVDTASGIVEESSRTANVPQPAIPCIKLGNKLSKHCFYQFLLNQSLYHDVDLYFESKLKLNLTKIELK